MTVYKDNLNAESVNAESKVEKLDFISLDEISNGAAQRRIQKLMRIQKLNKILKLKKLKNNRLSREHLQWLSECLPEPLDFYSIIHLTCSKFC
jgi:hypothetical protein